MEFRDFYVSIEPYYTGSFWRDPAANGWTSTSMSHVMQEELQYFISVSQDCTLTYNGISIELTGGIEGNYFSYVEPEPEPEPEPTPPPPPQPEGTFSSLFTFMAAIVGGIGDFFGTLEDAADSIPLFGDKLATPFRWIKDYCQDIEISLDNFDTTSTWVDSVLRDIRPWDWIKDAVSGTFFEGFEPRTWFADNFGDRIALDFSWLLDPFTSVWDNIKDQVIALIPTDIVKPWEVWDHVVDYVKDLISQIDIPIVPTFDEIWDWIRARFKDLDDISTDPKGWFSGMIGTFIAFATLPFWWAIEEFINRIWWEED